MDVREKLSSEKRLIDANALYQRLNERANDYALLDECTEQVIRDDMEIVQETPTIDAVEALGCRECKYCGDEDGKLQCSDEVLFARCMEDILGGGRRKMIFAPTENGKKVRIDVPVLD